MKGIIILNTGTPKTEQPRDVRQFIGEMLSDAKLLDLPNPFRYVLARWLIAPLRYKRVTEHYRLIWDREHHCFPLLHHVKTLCQKLEEKSGMPVEYAFRYGHPNVEEATESLRKRIPEMRELVVMSLFPHFAQSSYQTTVDQVLKYHNRLPQNYAVRLIKPYYNHPAFIAALSQRLKPYVEKPYDKLLFNYHSLPLRHLAREQGRGTDFDYVFQCEETLRLVSEHLGLDSTKGLVTYSSAIAKNWKEPFLENIVRELPANGAKNVVAVCAGFPSDNLESLFDTGIQASEAFKSAGGEQFTFVPGLNSEDFWVEAISNIIHDPQA